jgi:hypothetical protein
VTGECLVILRRNTALQPASIDLNLTVPLEKNHQSKQVILENSFNSHFLLRGRSAFVWRQAHIAGWLAPVGERSLLVIRPYL